jgi:hypothetical protein
VLLLLLLLQFNTTGMLVYFCCFHEALLTKLGNTCVGTPLAREGWCFGMTLAFVSRMFGRGCSWQARR